MTPEQFLSSYDYHLPPELIAQTPAIPRDSSRLLVVDSLAHQHSVFRELSQYLKPGDLLVLNNTKVIPARLYGRKSTGAPVEILLLEEQAPNRWLALVKPGRRFRFGSEIWFESRFSQNQPSILKAKVVETDEKTGGRILEFQIEENVSFWNLLTEFGEIPLPPYVTSRESQPIQYQTVYAQKPGAVAAPTAGLHFTKELLENLSKVGINKVEVTLHVGVGTFRPVEVEEITTHKMHQEWLEVNSKTVEQIRETKEKGGRIIAVGTTVVRALETAASFGQGVKPFCGKTDLFIYPGYKFQVIDGLITNFHLPRSSLLMLVSALVGRERLLSLYEEAIASGYRFYSFGDAMLILPAAKK
jgi:S-adenosylmethionine:tRNA ribosyltransferase-isomerase